MRIACLHTAQSNVAVFNAAAQQLKLPEASLHHEVRLELLAAAELAGGLTPDIEGQTCDALLQLGRCADAVLLTCSTLGPCVSLISAGSTVRATVPTIRVDRALAEEATRLGGKVVVLCAVETTLQPTARLFEEAAMGSGAQVEVRLVQGAWGLFKAGNHRDYLAAIADAADRASQDGAAIVALAQASMAGAAELAKHVPKPLTSPVTGLAAALGAIGAGYR